MSLVEWGITLMAWDDLESTEYRNHRLTMTEQHFQVCSKCVRMVGFDGFHEPLAERYLLQSMNARSLNNVVLDLRPKLRSMQVRG
jgi:hypothetical protein